MNGMTHTKLLERYDTMRHLSQQMLDAANRQDWDSLVEHQQTRSNIVEELKQVDKLAWDGPESQKKAELIRVVLAYDEQIKSLAENWMMQLRQNLSSIGTERKLQNLYQSAY